MRNRNLPLICLLIITGICFVDAGAWGEQPDNDEKQPSKKPKPAPTEVAGNIRFTTPPDWEKAEKKKGIVLLNPKGMTPTECSVVLVSGEQLKGDFLQWFKKKWSAFAKDLTVIEGGERTAQDGPGGAEVLYESALLGKEKTPQAGVLLWAAHYGTGTEWILFQASSAETFNKERPAVVELLAGIRLGSAPKVVAAPPKKAG